KLAAVRHETQQAQQRQMQEARATWDAFTAHEDAAFDAAHPELADPAARRQAQEAVLATLEGEGLSRQQIGAVYNQSDLLRSKAGQSILWKAAQWDRAQASMRNVRPAPKPPVQRPGVSMSRNELGRFESAQQSRGPLSLKEAAALHSSRIRGRR